MSNSQFEKVLSVDVQKKSGITLEDFLSKHRYLNTKVEILGCDEQGYLIIEFSSREIKLRGIICGNEFIPNFFPTPDKAQISERESKENLENFLRQVTKKELDVCVLTDHKINSSIEMLIIEKMYPIKSSFRVEVIDNSITRIIKK